MTLPEVMIASSILLVCLTALAGLLGTSVTSSSMAKMRDEAANMANGRIESARSMAYDRVGLVGGDPVGDIPASMADGKFVVTTECRWIKTTSGRAAYKQLTVHVAWQQPIPGQIEITTMIYGKSNIVTSGDVLVKLRYREDATPVQNGTVQLRTLDNTLRVVNSDIAGEAFFGQATIGAATLLVTPPAGCVVDTSTISNAVVAADSVTTLIVYVQRPAQATITVNDTSGSPVPGATVTVRRSDGTILPAAVTDSVGAAMFTQLLYSDYTVTVTKTGYPTSVLPFSVGVGSATVQVPFTVTPLLGVGIHARVFDASGTQLPGATVSVRASGSPNPLQTGVGGTNGEISFKGMDAGTFSVTVDKAGYTSQVKSTYLHDGDLDTLDFLMVQVAPTGNMHIVTRDKKGQLASYYVSITGPPPFHNDTLQSDDHGDLTVSNLSPGSYQVKSYSKSAGTATVLVNAGQTNEVAIYRN